MRDVIVVGAGGGGPVVAKELAARGLDVLLLEAGAAFEHSEREWSHEPSEANNPATGIFRFGPGDRTLAPWARDLPQNSFVWQTAGVGGSTVHYFGNSPRAMPGVFSDYAGADADAYDRDHAVPLGYRELIPYYEWVEHTLPVQTAAMGTKEERFLRAAEKLGWKAQTSKDITGTSFRPQENAILQPDGTAGRTADRKQLVYPRARGCTFCGHCPQGCIEPLKSPRNLRAKRSTHTSYVPMGLTADRWTHGKAVALVPDAFATRIETIGDAAAGVAWRNVRTGETTTEQAKVVVLAARGGGDRVAAPLAQQRLAKSERAGGERAHRPLPRLHRRPSAGVHGVEQGSGLRGARRLPRLRLDRADRRRAGAAGAVHGCERRRHCRLLRQRQGVACRSRRRRTSRR